MKKIILSMILTTFFSIALFGQNIEDFEKDFINATKTEFTETDLDKMFQSYSVFLLPFSDMIQLMKNGGQIVEYPLSKFKETSTYKNNINILFNSKNDNQRLLSYLVISGAGDKKFEKKLLERIKSEKPEANIIWAGMALMHLKTKHTTALFDFLVEYENFGDSHMIPLYIQLDKKSLQKTAYDRINSENVRAKILAAQILSITGKNKKTEKLLLDAVKNWDYSIKGYAIYSINELRIGNLKNDFIPLLDNPQTRSIAIQALANSPTKEDVDFVNQLLDNKGPVSEELLDGYYESKNIENIKVWLHLVSTREIPENYSFSVNEQPLLFSDELLKDVQKALKTTKYTEIQQYLIKVLEGRNDQESMDIIFAYLDSKDSSVRYWTVDILKGKQPVEVLNKLIGMLENPEQRVVSITNVLIENKIDSLQSTYEKIYQTEKSLDWQRSSIEYLSNFPKQNHKKIFLEILENNKSDNFIKRDAVMGLANLKDESSVDIIIKACEEESSHSDYNARTYLIALSKIKCEKARKYIEKYMNSKEKMVKDLAKELIAGWDN
ncbi:HEAT repeat domain-containing protein [Treponema zioleckii]|uniref:HEAT repeat domain-containing protein n=1 Tax=Treponema zioleckii TaxID=331680 RepID=UPI00168B8D8F|nr:HEAT repeat domain-containing protein [Treponema zioleckii]